MSAWSAHTLSICCDEQKVLFCNSIFTFVFQVVKMLFLVVAFFAVLWLPYRLLVVRNWAFPGENYDKWLLFFCRACYYLNSAANPIIYNFMSLNFRRAFKKMCPCLGKIMTPQNGSYTQRPGARTNTTYTTCSTNAQLQGDSVL